MRCFVEEHCDFKEAVDKLDREIITGHKCWIRQPDWDVGVGLTLDIDEWLQYTDGTKGVRLNAMHIIARDNWQVFRPTQFTQGYQEALVSCSCIQYAKISRVDWSTTEYITFDDKGTQICTRPTAINADEITASDWGLWTHDVAVCIEKPSPKDTTDYYYIAPQYDVQCDCSRRTAVRVQPSTFKPHRAEYDVWDGGYGVPTEVTLPPVYASPYAAAIEYLVEKYREKKTLLEVYLRAVDEKTFWDYVNKRAIGHEPDAG
jgi:hypothetical protein